MAGEVVIRAEGLGKKYLIGHEAEHERYVALRDVLARTAKIFWRKTADMARGRAIVPGDTTEEFWALRNVNFEINRGEVVGIIGRNGAGKSTLLKILSRITEPTEGRVTIDGRVASLLEVGTGFHPELTGRENIFLNGAILGMTQTEIKRKFDEIVSFADIERFLDTPVKRYSSGMYVRLAFAVAAHLEPEILVVDEVLAVGDAEFQKKSLGKMSSFASQGRTVLFVSHNMQAIKRFCSRAVLLEGGHVTGEGTSKEVVADYLRQNMAIADQVQGRELDEELDLVAFELSQSALSPNEPLDFHLELSVKCECKIIDLQLFIDDSEGDRVALVDFRDATVLGGIRAVTDPCRLVFSGRINRVPFVSGLYRVGICSRTLRNCQVLYDMATIEVLDLSSRQLVPYDTKYQGTTLLEYDYSFKSVFRTNGC